MKKAADRMSRWIDRIVSEDCADGIRPGTITGAAYAQGNYEEAKSRAEYLKHLKSIIR